MTIEIDEAAKLLKEVLTDMMVGFDTEENRDNFILDVVKGFQDKISIDPTLITAEWLCDKHPELSIEKAGNLKNFCESKTILHKDCYGDGEIMYTKWKQLMGI